jgi:hypothetical protein
LRSSLPESAFLNRGPQWESFSTTLRENEEVETIEASIDEEAKEGEEGVEKMTLKGYKTQLTKLVT